MLLAQQERRQGPGGGQTGSGRVRARVERRGERRDVLSSGYKLRPLDPLRGLK